MLRESPVSTVLDWAQEARMATGLVTTARVTHATPAALYAKTAHRDWEVRPRYYHNDEALQLWKAVFDVCMKDSV